MRKPSHIRDPIPTEEAARQLVDHLWLLWDYRARAEKQYLAMEWAAKVLRVVANVEREACARTAQHYSEMAAAAIRARSEMKDA